MNELNYAKELLTTAAILGSLAILTAAIAAILTAIVKLLERRDDRRDSEIARLTNDGRILRETNTRLYEQVAEMTNELITVRGANKGLNAEIEALEAENRALLAGTPVVRIKGRVKK